MMHAKIDWTTKLGEAFLNQSDELRHAIQSLRVKAQSVGNLESTEEQQVRTEQVNGGTVVRIRTGAGKVYGIPPEQVVGSRIKKCATASRCSCAWAAGQVLVDADGLADEQMFE